MCKVRLVEISRCEYPFLSHLAVAQGKDTDEDYKFPKPLCCCENDPLEALDFGWHDYFYEIPWENEEDMRIMFNTDVPICLNCLDKCKKLCPELMIVPINTEGGVAGYSFDFSDYPYITPW